MKIFKRAVPDHLYREFTNMYNIWKEEKENAKGWTCIHCGKSTYHDDMEYLISPTEHLACFHMIVEATSRRLESWNECNDDDNSSK